MRLAEAAAILGVSKHTLARWEREGKIPDHKTAHGRRFYTIQDVNKIKQVVGLGPKHATKRHYDPPEAAKVDWRAIEALNDTEFYDWYHSQPNEKHIIDTIPEHLVYRVMLARNAPRPTENASLSPGIMMPPE